MKTFEEFKEGITRRAEHLRASHEAYKEAALPAIPIKLAREIVAEEDVR
jgi:hypothetical protein